MLEPATNHPHKMNAATSQKLMVSGFIHLASMGNVLAEVRRGMPILTQDGREVGSVAAVVMDCHCQVIMHVLLGQVPPTAVYHLVPAGLIERVDRERIRLRTVAAEIEKLSLYQPVT